jgi:acylphosphatase
MRRAHIRVHGAVQGVFFRVETRDRARSLGVSGWVRNLPDGAVEAVFEGDEPKVESMVDWCHRGPSGADVRDVDVAWEEPQSESGFAVH